MRLCRVLLRLASRSVPLLRREGWLEEWEAELWTLHSRGARRGTLLRFAFDAIGEARWERREEEGAMGGLSRDLRYAWRRLSRNPGYGLVIVLVLALGIGANTALFGALKAALLDGPPYPAPDRLVTVDLLLQQRAEVPADTMPWSWPKFEVMRDNQQSLDAVAGWMAQTNTLTGEGPARRIGVEYVTPGYFDLLGVTARAGRVFGPAEEQASAVAVLSYGFWRSSFGGDGSVIGRTLTVEGVPLEVIGIAPETFGGLSGSADLWIPVSAIPAIRGPRRLQQAWAHWLNGIGRLGDGVSLAQARTDGERLGGLLTAAYPDPSGDGAHGVTMVPFQDARVNPVTRRAIVAVSFAGLLLLLIACGNVAGLMSARATAQRGDTIVRAALGAGRIRLLRESLVESLLLAGAGGAVGLLLAFAVRSGLGSAAASVLDLAGTRGLRFLSPESIGVNGPVLLAGTGLALLTALLVGILPARAATRFDLGADLRSGRAAVGRRATRNVGRSILVGVQLAFTVVLLAGAGLMAASWAGLSSMDVGFTNPDVLAVTWEFGPGADLEATRAFEAEIMERAAALAGVARVAVAPCPPLAGRCEVVGLRRLDDQPPIDYGDMNTPLLAYAVSDDYFSTLGIPVREGRTFGPADGPAAPPVAVINRAAAAELFGGTSALGHRLAVTHDLTPEDGAMAEIVGVVADVPYATLEAGALPAVYFSRAQAPAPYGTLFLAATGDPHALGPAVRDIAADIDPNLPLFRFTTLSDLQAAATSRTRTVLGLLGAFAAIALLLSAIGLYGMVAWSVARRTPEMGLRLALGAATRDVIALVLTPSAKVALIGAGAGLTAAFALTRYLGVLLFGIEPGDPRVVTGAAITLILVALVAALIPARRALRVDPATALRQD